ncbi:LisH and RanBPM domains containing protein [Abeliophyllum distichum]|uniref:LisH and RanBPM domains containing protein n=1 Tax=Abeliophyllum distichum TaxID=126358 RepID=A0ABD1UEY5_9LAMI
MMYVILKNEKGFTKEDWDEKLGEVKILKEDMNKLAMDYFLVEELVPVVKAFSEESATEIDFDLATIPAKSNILQKIKSHDAEGAINELKALDWLGLLDPSIVLMLQRQTLFQLIRDQKLEEAIEYAQERLVPLVEQYPQYEETMTRIMEIAMLPLVFTDPTNHLDAYLSDEWGEVLARLINSEIVCGQNRETETKLLHLLRTLFHVEKELDKHIWYPHLDVSSGILEDLGVGRADSDEETESSSSG